MRLWLLILALLALAGGAVWLWGLGGAVQLSAWAAEGQRAVQNAMAGLLRDLKTGAPGAFWGLMGLCFAYGFFHAAGPGHGKLVLGGYGAARRVAALRLAVLAVLASLAQALSAVGLVYGGVFLFDLSRQSMTGLADDWLAPASYIAIALVGVWLASRGARRLWQAWQHRSHGPDEPCGCGHAHGPSAAEAARVQNLRDALLVIGAVAIRPCTGALFLLILSWRIEIDLTGIAGAFVMGLGTASVTVLVALLSVMMRETAFGALASAGQTRRLAALLELGAGTLIALVALSLV